MGTNAHQNHWHYSAHRADWWCQECQTTTDQCHGGDLVDVDADTLAALVRLDVAQTLVGLAADLIGTADDDMVTILAAIGQIVGERKAALIPDGTDMETTVGDMDRGSDRVLREVFALGSVAWTTDLIWRRMRRARADHAPIARRSPFTVAGTVVVDTTGGAS